MLAIISIETLAGVQKGTSGRFSKAIPEDIPIATPRKIPGINSSFSYSYEIPRKNEMRNRKKSLR